MKILITGASGLVGTAIVQQLLQQDITINYLTTSKNKIKNTQQLQGYYWNPKSGIIDTKALAGVSVIINLAGASIAKPWTTKYKQEILQSRTQAIDTLYQALKNNDHQVKQLITASAIGIYADSLTNNYHEDSTQLADTFLAQVVKSWEKSANQLQDLNIKVCVLRIGLVLSTTDGAFPKLLKPINLGLGAAFATGKQWQSWIHLKDLAAIFIFAIHQELTGVYNAVAPNPVTNLQLMQTTAYVAKMPLWLPNIPEFALKLLLGEQSVLLTQGQKVEANKIQDKGFSFTYPNLLEAIQALLQKK